MISCAICSKKHGIKYDEKTKLYFCENHKEKNLIKQEKPVKKLVEKIKKVFSKKAKK